MISLDSDMSLSLRRKPFAKISVSAYENMCYHVDKYAPWPKGHADGKIGES